MWTYFSAKSLFMCPVMFQRSEEIFKKVQLWQELQLENNADSGTRSHLLPEFLFDYVSVSPTFIRHMGSITEELPQIIRSSRHGTTEISLTGEHLLTHWKYVSENSIKIEAHRDDMHQRDAGVSLNGGCSSSSRVLQCRSRFIRFRRAFNYNIR